MDWIARGAEKRCDPQKVLTGARSVVTLAMNYWQGDRDRGLQTAAPTRGRIARYAWGDDYHDVLEKKLRALDGFLTAAGGRQKFYVDTGPVLERDFAAEAGIGWHGKSTMLLSRQFGTWFFLAEIFTTLELPSDPPQVARCGSCTRCIDACPTGAITAPHQLDARRCISYLTIELKGSIPPEFRPLMGDRIFGCDDCLDACPWNRFAQISRESAFAARPAVAQMRLRDFLELDDEQFRALFAARRSSGSSVVASYAMSVSPSAMSGRVMICQSYAKRRWTTSHWSRNTRHGPLSKSSSPPGDDVLSRRIIE